MVTRGPDPAALRPGHSLAELIVAVTFLGVALGCVGASSVLGARWTGEALRRQEAVRVAASLLDSLSVALDPGSGALETDGVRLTWSVERGGPVRVTVETSSGRRLLEVLGWHITPPPALPDVASPGESAPAGGP